jgi:hypothetical protein
MKATLPTTPSAPKGVLHSNLTVIEVAEKITLDILLADAQTRRLILTRLSDRVAVVAPGQFTALLARLRKLGHTPKVLEG